MVWLPPEQRHCRHKGDCGTQHGSIATARWEKPWAHRCHWLALCASLSSVLLWWHTPQLTYKLREVYLPYSFGSSVSKIWPGGVLVSFWKIGVK